jgi:hypothetical protein
MSPFIHDMALIAILSTAILFFMDGVAVVRGENLRRHPARVQIDPDTTCREVYQKTPSKEACLAAEDHYGRPCAYCVDHGKEIMCYNVDEARWAKIFGDTCQTREGNIRTE